MKNENKSNFSCNNLHQVSSRLKGFSLPLRRWHQYVCYYRNLAQRYNGKLLKEFLSPSQSSSISTAKNRHATRISWDVKSWHPPSKNLPYHLCSLPTTTGGLKKERLPFQKSNRLLTSLALCFSAKLDTQVKESYSSQLAKAKNKRLFTNWVVVSLIELKPDQHHIQRWRKR